MARRSPPHEPIRWRHLVLPADADLGELASGVGEDRGVEVKTRRFDSAVAYLIELGNGSWIRFGDFEDVEVKIVEIVGSAELFDEIRNELPIRPMSVLRFEYNSATGRDKDQLLAQLIATENELSDGILRHARELSRSPEPKEREFFLRLASRFPWTYLRGRVAEMAFQDTDDGIRSLAQHVLSIQDGLWLVENPDGDERRFEHPQEWPALWLSFGWDASAGFAELGEEFGWVKLEAKPFSSKTRRAVVWETPTGGQVWLVADGYVNPHNVAFFARVFGGYEDFSSVAANVPALPAEGFRQDFEKAAGDRDDFLFSVLVTSYDPVAPVCDDLKKLSRSSSIHDRIRFATALRYAPWQPLRDDLEALATNETNEDLRNICSDRLRSFDAQHAWRR